MTSGPLTVLVTNRFRKSVEWSTKRLLLADSSRNRMLRKQLRTHVGLLVSADISFAKGPIAQLCQIAHTSLMTQSKIFFQHINIDGNRPELVVALVPVVELSRCWFQARPFLAKITRFEMTG